MNPAKKYKAGDEIPDDVHQWFGKYWCGCGYNDEGMAFLLEVMDIYQTREGSNSYSVDLEKLNAFEAKYGRGTAMFVLYMLDGTGITEHGGSVYGAWMTPLGTNLKDFLAANPDYES